LSFVLELEIYLNSFEEGSSTKLSASVEWDLTSDLPSVDPNLGLEAITWIPDSFLIKRNFFDANKKKLYDPSDYPQHGNGLFFVGLEGYNDVKSLFMHITIIVIFFMAANGYIYGYALLSNGSYHQITSVSSGETAVMSLEFDESSGYLWASCDSHCSGRSAILALTSSSSSSFTVLASYNRPSAMGNLNTEGFAIAGPDESMCSNYGLDGKVEATNYNSSSSSWMKAVFWADDDCTSGHAIRRGLLRCGELL
jgi:hypothetical protein